MIKSIRYTDMNFVFTKFTKKVVYATFENFFEMFCWVSFKRTFILRVQNKVHKSFPN